MTIKELISNSIRVTLGMVTISPKFYHEEEEIFNVSDIIKKFPGCFSINKATVYPLLYQELNQIEGAVTLFRATAPSIIIHFPDILQ